MLFSMLMRAHARVLCLALLTCLCTLLLPHVAHADAKSDYLATLKGRNDVPKILEANAYPCDMVEAFYSGKVVVETAGRKQELQIYEVACKGKKGALLRVTTQNKIDSVIGCDEAEVEKRRNKDLPSCVLIANKNSTEWMNAWVKPIFPKCDIVAVLYVGKATGTSNKIYEVACKGGASGGAGFYTLPENADSLPTASEPLAFVSCLRALNTDVKCTRTDAASSINNYRPLAWQASKGCVPSDVRFMGGTKDQLYFEVLCEDKSVMVIVTDRLERFQAALSCPDAAKRGATCQFEGTVPTNLASKAAAPEKAAPQDKAKLSAYNATLSQLGKVCTVSAFRQIGADPVQKRELVEFKCQETPYGLAGYLPLPESTASADLTDCFVATLRKFECQYYAIDAQKKRIVDLADESNFIKADCVVKDMRFVGATPDQDLTVEIACENKRGYIAVITPARDKIERALPCSIAANRAEWDKCALPGNGTYSSQ